METESTDAERKRWKAFFKWWFAVGSKLKPENMETDQNHIQRVAYHAWVAGQELDGE